MKGLSTEEKAKAYDEALENARQEYNTTENVERKQWLEGLFPELAESEDDKIRKELIDIVAKSPITFAFEDKNKVLSWLERQGEHTDKIVERAKIEKQRVLVTESDGSANIDWDTRSLEDAKKLLEYGLQYINTELEKQAEVVSDKDDIEAEEKGIRKAFDKIWEEKQDKQKSQRMISAEAKEAMYDKPADKAELKFRVGNWIVNNISKDVFLIKSINNGYCTLEDIKGNIISPCLPPCESESHLWTIADAKKGDVLVSKDKEDILIYKSSSILEPLLTSYISFSKKEGFCPRQYSAWDSNEFIPATKEQRDLLFSKMKEAGYEWDAEKKELKKIEQKPTIEMITPEESLSIDSETYNKIVDECIYGEQASAWSEKDREMIDETLYFIREYQQSNRCKDESGMQNSRTCEEWLESLKERIGG